MMQSTENEPVEITGRCYCGKTTFRATRKPQIVVYCHCADCRRATGAPVAAFAAFDDAAVTFTPDEGRTASAKPGAARTFCTGCGTPLAGRYDYLPGQVFVAIGILDRAEDFAPQLHAHDAERLPWLHIDDDLERVGSSSREQLSTAKR